MAVLSFSRKSSRPCLDPAEALALAETRMGGWRHRAEWRHVAECPACRQTLRELRALESVVAVPAARPAAGRWALAGLAAACAAVLLWQPLGTARPETVRGAVSVSICPARAVAATPATVQRMRTGVARPTVRVAVRRPKKAAKSLTPERAIESVSPIPWPGGALVGFVESPQQLPGDGAGAILTGHVFGAHQLGGVVVPPSTTP